MEEMSQFVSNVGFPIVACIFMYFNQKELNRTINELESDDIRPGDKLLIMKGA